MEWRDVIHAVIATVFFLLLSLLFETGTGRADNVVSFACALFTVVCSLWSLTVLLGVLFKNLCK